MEVPLWIVGTSALFTAVMTGVGALPFLFVRRVGPKSLGASNAAACGLMLAASHGLIVEGTSIGVTLTVVGLVAGLAAILVAKAALDRAGDVEVADLTGAGATKALLILGVMTAHSFAEGIGVGVAFAGREGLGAYVTAAIALHNVPEGLAIALVLVPQGMPVWKVGLWAIFTSLPQPIMALPAYVFVESFGPFLPVGLGLAAGAMIWMVFSELFPDALEGIDKGPAAAVVVLSFSGMLALQLLVLAH